VEVVEEEEEGGRWPTTGEEEAGEELRERLLWRASLRAVRRAHLGQRCGSKHSWWNSAWQRAHLVVVRSCRRATPAVRCRACRVLCVVRVVRVVCVREGVPGRGRWVGRCCTPRRSCPCPDTARSGRCAAATRWPPPPGMRPAARSAPPPDRAANTPLHPSASM
jgi:hypothetical protein